MNGPPAADAARTAAQPSPELRVVRGHPTPEELTAALVAIRALTAAGAPEADPAPEGAPDAAAGSRGRRLAALRRPLTVRGPGAWRRSGWS
ncbi:acyl-CoA carboxylase subunit epsilon [Streptomyces sp. TS71-3]|uniref:acyl-CoA carboxylase subunit epsilon n=1 Tax=Streptomyces sp. TS71-3 TaxID=2733862 RepID=UPI001B2F5130|nr:acyl-CoA carboxylase subunit epsilon [Streptomyces sp. TS71-3]GHJ40931.1 hypothetical protein Sm713_65400 [Streptomyces sp. TS71-3]